MSTTTKTLMTFSDGQRVRILDREPNPSEAKADTKGAPYYGFYAGLSGTVVKSYDDGTVAVSVDRRTLVEPLQVRHDALEAKMRGDWLNKLSEEELNRLTEKQKNFTLRYTLLVGAGDLIIDDSPVKRHSAPKAHSAVNPTLALDLQAEPSPEPAPARPSLQDLEAQEEAYLNQAKKNTEKP